MSNVIERPNRLKTKTKEFKDALEEIGREPCDQFNFKIPRSLAKKLDVYCANAGISRTHWLIQHIKSIKVDL